MGSSTLPERVGQLYYTYGLFSSSHPIPAIAAAISLVLLCCYPLLNIPLPGTLPTVITLPLDHDASSNIFNNTDSPSDFNMSSNTPANSSNSLVGLLEEIHKLPHVWSKEKPLFYIQQIIMKTGVTPWNGDLLLWDAFRGPIQEVYRLLEIIRNHQDAEKHTFSDICYHVDTVKKVNYKDNKEQTKVLPEYSCLMLSPANLWQQNLQHFAMDANIVNTIFSYQNLQKGKVSIAEMAFGMQLRDAGIKRYPLRSRPRALQYAVTLFYQNFDEAFIDSLKNKLLETYSLHRDVMDAAADEIILTYYPGKFNYRELVPLSISFVGLFLYVYFSVRKIEFVKSKLGLAICAVITIGGSLSMSMGLCFFFGLSLSLQSKEIFPYLVILVGLENVLVLTKSVTSTDSRLDVKIRLAQGLSKEGWSITKNLLIEITILTVSLFTFVPVIQEFSIFMIVSLISDFIIQMIFFATILGIDVRRMEYYQEKNNKLQFKDYFNSANALNWRFANSSEHSDEHVLSVPQKMIKSKSHPRLNGLANSTPTDVVANLKNSPTKYDKKLPKRIRLVNIWARTRFFQRAFMVWMVVWISIIVYNSGIIEHFIEFMNSDNVGVTEKPKRSTMNENHMTTRVSTVFDFYNHSLGMPVQTFSPLIENSNFDNDYNDTNESISLKHNQHVRPWRRLSKYHWSSILSQYNESVAGKYVVSLPPVLVSCRISPELAVTLRHPDERNPAPLRWQALAAALDPIDIISDLEAERGQSQQRSKSSYTSELPIYPTTPMEILLLAILCGISVVVIAYTMVVFYKVVCTRNYAEWRASWSASDDVRLNSKQQQLVMEAVPMVVSGHRHEVECVATDGERIVSSCLNGTIKVWDAKSGDMLTKIDRYAYFSLQKEINNKRSPESTNKSSLESLRSDCEMPLKEEIDETKYNQTEKSQIILPTLRTDLRTHLQNLKTAKPNNAGFSVEHLPTKDKTKYDFAKWYRELYTSEPSNDYRVNEIQPTQNEIIVKEDNEVIKTTKSSMQQNVFKAETIAKDIPVDNTVLKNKTKVMTNILRNRVHDKFVYASESSVYSEDVKSVKSDDLTNTKKSDVVQWEGKPLESSPIWCMDFSNDLIILGCADGRLEFWEASSGKLMCIWREGLSDEAGLTCVRTVGSGRVAATGLAGRLLLLRLDVVDAAGARKHWRHDKRSTHVRTGSAGSIQIHPSYEYYSERRRMDRSPTSYVHDDINTIYSDYDEEVRCVRVGYCKPHQQPISVMEAEGGRILTGGQDHVLKVFSSMNLTQLFTLHGHCGPITSCFIDRATPTIGGSGSQDGLLCVWDLHTGTCLYSMQAHDGAVTSLSYTASYVISAGSDERLCIWDRFQGHMLNSIHIGLGYTSNMLPLTHSLLVMGDRNGIAVYDLSSGDVVRRVLLGQNDGCVFVRQVFPLKDAIVCDYGNQLRIVRFPLVSKLTDTKTD